MNEYGLDVVFYLVHFKWQYATAVKSFERLPTSLLKLFCSAFSIISYFAEYSLRKSPNTSLEYNPASLGKSLGIVTSLIWLMTLSRRRIYPLARLVHSKLLLNYHCTFHYI